MPLREGDSYGYLRLKEKMVESDHDAIFSDGRQLPVCIYQKDGQTKYVVERDYQFFEAKLLPGFLRLQKQPDVQPRVVEPPPVESTKLRGSTWAELKADAEGRARKALAERFAGNQQQQGMPTGDPALTQAGRNLAQVVAASKGQRT